MRQFGFFVSLCALVLIFNTVSLDARDRFYAPHQSSRAYPESLFVDVDARDFVQFWWNRGPEAVSLLDHFLHFISPEEIRGLKGFRSYAQTRLSIHTYEIRSREVVDAIERLLEKGMSVRVVADGKNHREFQLPSSEEWASWSEKQQAYFLFAYDDSENPDGSVNELDAAAVNSERYLAVQTWKRLKSLKRKFGAKVDLVLSPNEVVPVNDSFHYPRNHHFKGASLEFRSSPHSKTWGAPVRLWTGSANFTDAGLDQKVAATRANRSAYVSGAEYEKDSKSQGHIQFGALFGHDKAGPEIMEALMGPVEKWVYAYRRGRHYDSVPIRDEYFPRIVFADGSSLQAFFSEGQRLDGSRSLDPVKVIEKILSRPDIELTAYYDTQFVFTHHAHAKLLRRILNHHRPEKFFLAVDSSQALEEYSALPTFLFAPEVNELPGSFPGRALNQLPPLELDWKENVMVYRGGIDLHRRENDKLHSKAKYFRYIDPLGEAYCVVYFGSGNATYNVAKLSSDAMFLFSTPDQALCDKLESYFESLRADSRMESFDAAYLERHVKAHFFLSRELESKSFYKRFADFIHARGQKRTLASIVKTLEKAGPMTAQGRSLLKWLKWHLKYRPKLTHFDWSDFYLILRLSQDERLISEELAQALFDHWTEGVKNKRYAQSIFTRTLREVSDAVTLDDIETELTGDFLEDAKRRLMKDCVDFMKAVRANSFERRKHRVTKARVRAN